MKKTTLFAFGGGMAVVAIAAGAASGTLLAATRADGHASPRRAVVAHHGLAVRGREHAVGSFSANVTNPWFPLTPGTVATSRGTRNGAPAREVVTVLGRTATINGVPCAVVDDRLFVRGRLVARATSWYSQDGKGRVWAYGRASATLDAGGHVRSTAGSWRAGVRGARPGIFMPARPVTGQILHQGRSAGHPGDHSRIVKLNASVRTPFARSAHALLIDETTTRAPRVVTRKHYVRGIGPVTQQTVSGGRGGLALVSRTGPPAQSFSGRCGTGRPAPAVYDHIIWITFENQSYKDVIGNTATQPFINQLAGECGLATNFFPEQHPSLPNYIAMTSGGTQGVTGDSSGQLNVDNIYSQVKASGRQWRQYAFGMPSNCSKSDYPNSSKPIYTAHHEAVVYYPNVAADCPSWDIPVSPRQVDDVNDVTTSPLAKAVDSNTLPAFTVIGPSDDGGNSSLGGQVDPKLGDPFLKRWVDKITSSAGYQSGKTAIFITWDEGSDFGASPSKLATIPMIVVAQAVPKGARSAVRFDHYSMLRTTEEMLGIKTFLGSAASAPSMRGAFQF